MNMNVEKKKINSRENGFSMIEIMISISVMGIILATSFSILNNRKDIINLEDTQASIINALTQAQNRAVTGVGDTDIVHGVCIDTSSSTIALSEGGVCGIETKLPCSISTDQPTIEFHRLSGEPENTATININCSGSSPKEINITENGAIISE